MEQIREENRRTVTKVEAQEMLEDVAQAGQTPERREETEKVKQDTDALLDEIDEMMREVNPVHMVHNFIQQPGQ